MAAELQDPTMAEDTYRAFLQTKTLQDIPTGITVPVSRMPSVLFDWQRALTAWALQRGRGALFAATGLGKTLMQCTWASHVPGRTLILAPLGVTHQTIAEAQDKLRLTVQYVRRPSEMTERVCITNYDLLEHFCDLDIQGIVLDESSCLKGITSQRRKLFFEHFTHIPFRLCCTATPAPNDIAEMAMHAEFLGVMTRAAMLATFFVHDDTGWRLMEHARVPFYRWLASWAMALQSPADLGYDGSAFVLPPLILKEHFLPWDGARLLADGDGQLGIAGTQKLHGIGDRMAVRQQTIALRAKHAARMIQEALWHHRQKNISESITTLIEIASLPMRSSAQQKKLLKNANNDCNTTESGMSTIEQQPYGNSKKGAPRKPMISVKHDELSAENIISETERLFAKNNETTLKPIQTKPAQPISGNMTLPLTNTTPCLPDKKGAAPSAQPMPQSCEKVDSISTTAIIPAQYEDCSANPAIWDSENSAIAPPCSAAPQTTLTTKPLKWVVWCGLDEEQRLIAQLLGDDCVSVYGSLTPEEKVRRERLWREGDVPVMVTKAKIFGWGINWQCCSQAVFLGMNDSMELFYQAVRRLWRYGQTHPVTTHIVLSEHERPIWDNVQRKEREARAMIGGLIEAVKGYEQGALAQRQAAMEATSIREHSTDQYHVWHGDSCEVLPQWPENSRHLAVFSPPFAALYQYSDTERDLGNCHNEAEFFTHFGFIADALLRAMVPGRIVAMHLSEIPAMLVRDGWIGFHNFVGHMCDHMTAHGWIRHGEVVITKSPQAQAIRMHPKGLSFTQLRKDASWMRPALVDKILLFRKPGENPIPIISDVDNDTWIKWANGVWQGIHEDQSGIRETDTLNAAEAREAGDTKHIAPLQLGVIERCIRLWSNPGESVCSPFMGLGSEGYQALRFGRRFYGIELKASYYETALKNLERAMAMQDQLALL